jgi:hypothetical protein
LRKSRKVLAESQIKGSGWVAFAQLRLMRSRRSMPVVLCGADSCGIMELGWWITDGPEKLFDKPRKHNHSILAIMLRTKSEAHSG